MDSLINKNGFSTIEILIALAVITLTITAVATVSFSNQLFFIGTQTNNEATSFAQETMQKQEAKSRKDFNLVNSTLPENRDIYSISSKVTLLPDFLTKKVTTLVEWKNPNGLIKNLTLTTLVSNFENVFGSDTCDSNLSGKWLSPQIQNSVTDFATLAHDSSQMYTLSDIDIYKGKLYVTASNTSGVSKPTLFIFDAEKIISDPGNSLLSSIDNEQNDGTTKVGLNAIRVSEDSSVLPDKIYAYTANAYGANYTTCNPMVTKNCGELGIFDVSDSSNIELRSNLKIASSPAVTGTTSGNSISYKNGFLLLGLVATTGPEFHLLDMHNPTTKFSLNHTINPLGSFEVGHDINMLTMRGKYVYLTIPHDNTAKELQILDVKNLNSPNLVGGYNMSGGGNGKSIYIIGDDLYFGNTVPNTGNDLHILENTNPAAILAEKAGLNSPSSINAILVRDYITFILTNDSINLYKTDDLGNIKLYGGLELPIHSVSPIPEPSMDCEGNTLYITSNDSTGHGALFVIGPQV